MFLLALRPMIAWSPISLSFPSNGQSRLGLSSVAPNTETKLNLGGGLSRARRGIVAMRSESLDKYEQRTLAGVWNCELDTDDGLQNINVYLKSGGACTSTPEFKYCRWEATKKKSDGSSKMSFKLRLGERFLEGSSVWDKSSRCTSITGIVLEGSDEPVYVGQFKMKLVFPEADDEEFAALQQQHKTRIETRRAKARFRQNAFFGKWKLLLEVQKPLLLTIQLREDGKFTSDVMEGVRLAGTWGVYDSGYQQWQKMHAFGVKLGSHVWIRIERAQSTGIQESFRLWGKPELDSPLAELMAKSKDGSDYADSVFGECYFGAMEPTMDGVFALRRDS